MKKRYIFLIFLFIIFLFSGGKKVTEEELYAFAEEGNGKEIYEFINDNCTSDEKTDLVDKSIELFIEKDLKNNNKNLEDLFFEKHDKAIKNKILEAYIAKGKTFINSEELVDLYLGAEGTDLKDNIKNMVNIYSDDVKKDMLNCDLIYNRLNYYLEKKTVDEFIGILNELKNLELLTSDEVANIKGSTEELVENMKNLDKVKDMQENIENELKDINPPEGPMQNLHIFIVQRLESSVIEQIFSDEGEYYEVSFSEYDSFFGEMPSSDIKNRALLKTQWTSFTSRGWTDIYTVYAGEKEVETSEENGSFIVKIPFYKEISKTYYDKALKYNELYELGDSVYEINQHILDVKKDILAKVKMMFVNKDFSE